MKRSVFMVLLALLVADVVYSQTYTQQLSFKDTTYVGTAWEKIGSPSITYKQYVAMQIFNYGPGGLEFAIRTADTASAVDGASRYFLVPTGKHFEFDYIAAANTDSVWCRATLDSAAVQIYRW